MILTSKGAQGVDMNEYQIKYREHTLDSWTVMVDTFENEFTANEKARNISVEGYYVRVVFIPTDRMVTSYSKGGRLLDYRTAKSYTRPQMKVSR